MLCLVMWFQTAFEKLVEITLLAISSLNSKETNYYDQNLRLSSMLCLMMWLQTSYNNPVEVTILAISSLNYLRQNTKTKSYVSALCCA